MNELPKDFIKGRTIIGRYGNKSIIEHISRDQEIEPDKNDIVSVIDGEELSKGDIEFIVMHVQGMLLNDKLREMGQIQPPYFMAHFTSFYRVYGDRATDMAIKVANIYNKVKEWRD